MSFSYTKLVAGTLAASNKVNDIFDAIQTALNNIGPTNMGNTQILNNALHGFLGTYWGSGKYHNSADIYGALRTPQTSYHATTPATCTVTIPAYSAVTGIIVMVSAELELGAGDTNVHLPINFKSGTTAAADLSAGGTIDPRFELSFVGAASQTVTVTRVMDINATTVPTLGGGFAHTLASVIKIGTAYGDGTASKYSIVAIAY